jgi:hypothetical protein
MKDNSKGNDATRGIYARGELVPIPAKFPLEEQEKLYFLDRDEMRRLDTLTQIAVKYTGLYLENPLLEGSLPQIAKSLLKSFATTGITTVGSPRNIAL